MLRSKPSDTNTASEIYASATVITTFPFLCPCSTYLKASLMCSKGNGCSTAQVGLDSGLTKAFHVCDLKQGLR